MSGNITRRGKHSFRLKFEGERDPVTGKRKIYYETFRGSRDDAKKKLTERINAYSGQLHRSQQDYRR